MVPPYDSKKMMVSLVAHKLIRHAVHAVISILYEKTLEYNKNSTHKFYRKDDFL